MKLPQKVVGLLEVGSTVGNLVDQVLNAYDSVLPQVLLYLLVVLDGDSGTIFLDESALVNQLRDRLLRGIPIGDARLDESEHLDGGFVELDENAVLELSQSQKSQDLSWLRMQGIYAI